MMSMDGWNVIPGSDREYSFINEDETRLTISKRVPHHIVPQLLSMMEELRVPIAYTQDLKDVRICILKDMYGYYYNDSIRLSYGVLHRDSIARTFVHELGHHIDGIEGISDDHSIRKEKSKKARFTKDAGLMASAGSDEYVASGFEVYYFGSSEEKAKFRRHNRQLFEAIAEVHRKYRRR